MGINRGMALGACIGLQGTAMWLLFLYQRMGYQFCPKGDETGEFDLNMCSEDINTIIGVLVSTGVAALTVSHGAVAGNLLFRGRSMLNALTFGLAGSKEEGPRCAECTTLISP